MKNKNTNKPAKTGNKVINIKDICGKVIFRTKAKSFKEAVIKAIKAKVNLSRANFMYKDLSGLNMSRQLIEHACFHGTDLTGTLFFGATLIACDFQRTTCDRTDFECADLSKCSFYNATFKNTNFTNTDLHYTTFSTYNIEECNGLELALARTKILPEGDIIGWKKLRDKVIAKLSIPADAQRSHTTRRKCRASYAKVLGLYKSDNNGVYKKYNGLGKSIYDCDLVYKVGAIVRPCENFDTNPANECSTGIHFYITKEEAIAHG